MSLPNESRDDSEQRAPIESDLFEFDATTALHYNRSFEIIKDFNDAQNEVIQSIKELLDTPSDTQRKIALDTAIDQLADTFSLLVENINENTENNNERVFAVTNLTMTNITYLKTAFPDEIKAHSSQGKRQYDKDKEAIETVVTTLYSAYQSDKQTLQDQLAKDFVERIVNTISHIIEPNRTPQSINDANTSYNTEIIYGTIEPTKTDSKTRTLGKVILKAVSIGVAVAGGIITARYLQR